MNPRPITDEISEEEIANIKETLFHFGKICCQTRDDAFTEENIRWHLGAQDVLPSVIDWVMS